MSGVQAFFEHDTDHIHGANTSERGGRRRPIGYARQKYIADSTAKNRGHGGCIRGACNLRSDKAPSGKREHRPALQLLLQQQILRPRLTAVRQIHAQVALQAARHDFD